MFEIVPATHSLMEDYYGRNPRPTVRAWVALEDGKPVGVAGVAYRGEALEVFSDLNPIVKEHPVALYRTALRIMGLVRKLGRPAFATRNPNEPTADALLRRLGFVEEGVLYRWHGE